MNTATKKKRQATPAQELKKELKKQYPDLIVSCTYDTYSMGASIHVDIKNLHLTPYSLYGIQELCNQFSKVRKDEYGDILSGGNTFVMVNNKIDNEIQKELDQMFIAYLSIYKEYENIKTIEYNLLIELPSKHREAYQNLLGNQAYSELREHAPEVKQEETMNTIENTTNEDQAIKKEKDLDQDLLTIRVQITKREKLLDYLKQNGINGKIQQATEEEIKELKEKLDKHEQELIKIRIKNSHDFICDEAKKMLDALNNNDCETIENCLKEIAFLNNDLKQDLDKLKSITTTEETTPEVITIDPEFTSEIEIEKPELVLTAPPTDPQNVIELFPQKKTLDQLRKELNTPEQYQDLIDNFDSYCKKYDNLTLHGLQLIRDDYSKKDANGELSLTYDQWFKFMQSYEDLTNELRKKI